MMASLLTIVEVVALLLIVWHCLCALNHMGPDTPIGVSLAVVLVFTATLSRGYLLTAGDAEPGLIHAALAVGIALGMLANRRRRITCPCLPSWPHVEPGDGDTTRRHGSC